MRKLQRLLCAVIAVTVLAMLPAAASAEEQYYKTWEAYTQANGIDTVDWHLAADAIDIIIQHACDLYEAGDAAEAYEYAKATYWGYYETTGFERNVLTYVSGSRVSLVELQFTSFRKAIKKDMGIDTVREEG